MTENEPDAFEIWTIYEHPKDFPTKYVARLWKVSGGIDPAPEPYLMASDTLEALRDRMLARGLTVLPRDPNDDPSIVENWV